MAKIGSRGTLVQDWRAAAHAAENDWGGWPAWLDNRPAERAP